MLELAVSSGSRQRNARATKLEASTPRRCVLMVFNRLVHGWRARAIMRESAAAVLKLQPVEIKAQLCCCCAVYM